MHRTPHARRVSAFLALTLLAAAAHAQSQPTVGNYQLQSETRFNRTKFDYVYKATLTNPGAALSNVTATLTSLSAATVVIDGSLTFGNVAAGATAVSTDTFTIRQDRTVPFNPANLQWAVSSSPANRAPTANAGADRSDALVGTPVTLNGSASSDPDGNPLTYQWTITDRPANSVATLLNATSATPSLTPDKFGSYTVSLVVRDGTVNSTPDTVQITTQNRPPTAKAGPDSGATLGATVTLNGSGSSDLDGQPLTFAWSFVSKPNGSAAMLSNPSAAMPAFTVDQPGSYQVRLTVSDGIATAQDDVTITTANPAPTAEAGANRTVTAGATVQLDGSASSDPNGDLLQYQWTLKSKPANSTAALSNSAIVNPTFVADKKGNYVIGLKVYDGTTWSAEDLVTITSDNTAPVANAGADQTVTRGQTVQLNGTASSDVNGQSLTYLWSFTQAPAGANPTLSNPTAANPTFVASQSGTYIVQLVVNDGIENSTPDTVIITSENTAPVANAGPDQTVAYGRTVQLNGAASSDANNDPLTYEWSFQSRPAGSTATLSGATTVAPTFVADRVGEYVVQLIVRDGTVASAADTVRISTTNSKPVANAGPDQSVNINANVVLSGALSSDADNNPLTYTWSFTSFPGTQPTLTGANTSTASFVPTTPGLYVAQLIVNDGATASDPDTVSINVLGGPVGLAVTGGQIGAGRTGTLQVTLPVAAAGTGVVVSLTSDNSSILTLATPTVTIPAGQTTATVTVNGIASGATNVRATAPGYAEGVLNVQVTANLISTPTTLSVPLGQTTSLPISIPSAAPAGGVMITVTSSAPGVIQVETPTVVIPAGQISVNATVRGVSVGSAVLSASNPNYAGDSTDAQSTGSLNITQASASFNSAAHTDITLQLEGAGAPVAAPAGGITVSLSATDSTCVAVPATAVIAAGTVNVSARLTYGGTATLPCTTMITASGNGLAGDTMTVTVNPTPGITLNSMPARVGTGLQVSANGTLGSSQHSGVTITITSANPAVALVSANGSSAGAASAEIPVSAGTTSFSFYVHGVAEGATTITASAPGYNDSAAGGVTVVAPVIRLTSVPTSIASLAPDNPFYAQIGISNSNGAFTSQNISMSAQPVTVTFTSSDPTVAQLANTSTTAGSLTATIGLGGSNTPTSLSNGGVALDPMKTGTTTITATAPGFTGTSGASVEVTVTGQSITLNSNPARVGAGLQTSATLSLGASQHGGITLRIAVADPAVARVAATSSAAGTEFIDVPVANGTTSVTYYLQGVTAGSTTVTASSDQFTPASGTVEVLSPVLRLQSVSTSMTSFDANNPFYAQIGISTNGTAITTQNVSPVAEPVQITFSSSDPAVAAIVTSGASGASRTIAINPGQSNTPTSVANGGVALDPLTVGTTTVTATAPGFTPLPSATVNVSITGAGISLGSLPATVGARLQASYTATLGASQHGGVTVRIASSNPAVALISASASAPGSEYADFTLNNGSTNITYYIQGVSIGTATITASNEKFTSASGTVNIVQPSIRLTGVLTSIASLAPNDAFYAQVGVSSNGTNLTTQNVSASSAPVTLMFNSSNPAVATLATSSQSSGTLSLVINPGSSATPQTVNSGGISLDPLTTGSTAVTVSADGFNQLPDATVNVTVTGQGMTMTSLPTSVGAGLQASYTLTLGASQHGGVTVRIASSNPAIALVSPNAATPGSEFIDVAVPNGTTSVGYYIQGVENANGTITITATAPGFTNGSGTATILQPSIRLRSLNSSYSATAANSAFYAEIGIITSSFTTQHVRAGALPVAVTFTSSNPAAGQLVTSSTSGATITLAINPGSGNTVTTVASGGVAFDPLATGTTVVSVSAPGFQPTSSSSQTVTVN